MSEKEKLELLEKGFFKHNNYHVEKIEEGNVELKADITENALNPYGIAHGGFLFGLGDMVMGIIASKNGRNAVTMNSHISFLSPAKGKYILARGELIKEGKTTCVVRANIYDDQEKIIAIMEGTYYYI